MRLSRRGVLATACCTVAGVAGCLERTAQTRPTPAGTKATTPTGTPPPLPAATATTYAYTHIQPTGNRVLNGRGDIRSVSPVDIPVDGTPAWLLAFGASSGTLWTVVTENRDAHSYRVTDDEYRKVTDHGTVSTPPLGIQTASGIRLLDGPWPVAQHTHPVPVDGGVAYVARDGTVHLWQDETTTRFEISAPPDMRVLPFESGRCLVYGDGVTRYRHGALGDSVEPASVCVLDTERRRIETKTRLDPPLVFEGLSPLVADLDSDGTREIVTTLADPENGARIGVYGLDGTLRATGPIYGSGWRHQLCVAGFPPDGHPEIAVVRKPPVDRTLEFYRLTGDTLSITATVEGFATHTYGSRTLGGALAADLDGDGRIELLAADTERSTLRAVRRTRTGATAVWSLPLDGSLSTNLTGVATRQNQIAVGAGTPAGLRVWQTPR